MVILGLLSHEDLTGYDIKKRIDSHISFFWKGSFGSIYPALSGLQEQGMIVRRSCGSGSREKISYSITEDGRICLNEWLRDSNACNDLKYETLVKLFFGGAAGRETSIRNIDAFEKDIRRDLEVLKMYKENLEKDLSDDHIYFYLTVTFGIDTYEGYLKWCSKARKLLRNSL